MKALLAPVACIFIAPPLLLAHATPATSPVQLLSFEEPGAEKEFSAGGEGVKIERVAEHATEGRYSLKVTFPPFDPRGGWWPSANLILDPPEDWSGYRRLEVDVFNPQSEEAEVGLAVAGWYGYFPVSPQSHRTVVAFLRQGAAAVTGVYLLMRLQVKRPKAPTVFHFDNVRLIPKTLDDPESVSIWLRPPATGGKLLASVPARRIEVELTTDLSADQRDSLTVRARLGRHEQSEPLRFSRGTLALPVPHGEATVEVELLNGNGESVRRFSERIRRPRRARDEVGIDASGRCLVNGKPFFPIGIYNAGSPEDWPRLKTMGFNCVGPYFEVNDALDSRAKALGLRLLSSTPKTEAIESFAMQGKRLSSLLGYYLFDEPMPGDVPPVQLASLCQRVADVDPYHLTTGCNNDYFSDYAGVSDVMMVDAYPMPKGFQHLIDRMTSATLAMEERGPVWLIPQCFGWEAYCEGEQPNSAEGRPPTYDELRSMVWLGISLGAKGIIFYSFAVQDNQCRYSWPILWKGLEATIKELSALSRAALSTEVPLKISNPSVYGRAWEWNRSLIVALTNAADTRQAFAVSGVNVDRLHCLGEPGQALVHKGEFRGVLPPRTTRLYTSRPLNLSTPDVGATRARLGELQRARDEFYARDLALHERGATLETSWGLPTNVPAFAWRRVIDGYRGTSWRVGDSGYFLRRSGEEWPIERTSRGERWIEVRLPKPTPTNRVAVVSANAKFEVLLGLGNSLHPIPVRSRQSREFHPTEPVEVAEADLSPTETLDRLRLRFTRDAQPDKPELLFEIEASAP